jgi:hypothetical protein
LPSMGCLSPAGKIAFRRIKKKHFVNGSPANRSQVHGHWKTGRSEPFPPGWNRWRCMFFERVRNKREAESNKGGGGRQNSRRPPQGGISNSRWQYP